MADLDLTVVGIGASAGGLEAFHGFFANMPADSGMAFVVILHLPANRPSMLSDILRRWTAMEVRDAVGGERVLANTVYVPPPHAVTVLRGGRLHVRQPAAEGPRDFRPIDAFFDTLADTQRERAVGIVLSGTGSDGALGLKAVRACGGLTLAQLFAAPGGQPVTHHTGMPTGAIATGAVDMVVAVQDMPGHIIRLAGRAPMVVDAEPAEAEARGPPDLPAEPDLPERVERLRLRVCDVLRTRVGHDFSNYKEKTFLRRVARRMQVNGYPNLADYARFLEEDAGEPMLLFRDLLIRVTAFFRDTEAFDAVERLVIPRLFAGRHADNTVRVWVPGCSTGEEAYSIAILIREHMDGLRGNDPSRLAQVQIFATDIDEAAVGTARLGRYPAVLLEGLSDKRRNRFFSRSEAGYVVAKEIRDICTFSTHSLVRDPPFSRIDLVSCRNLLIYLDSDLQAKVIPSFHYALSPGGMLILGISESTSRHEDLFELLDKTARIFMRRNVRTPPIQMSARLPVGLVLPGRPEIPAKPAIIAAPAPATRRMDDRGEATAPHRLRGLARGAEQVLTVLLGSSRARQADALEATRRELQAVREEQETAVEELRSANEELHSVNEELQSTNEELETSKEEIQSVNEELHTVNAQLQEKVDELDRVNSDLKNLFDSTQIATVFLDRYLIVRGFTPAISGIYNLIPSDVGRPLTDIGSPLRYDTLRADVAKVLETLNPLERQVTSGDGQSHYILRILPYRGSDSAVSGTLVTFLEVSSVVRAEKHQRLLVDELNHRVKNMLTVVISLASQTLRRTDSLEAFSEAFLGRVHALSASYTLLSRENWTSISLRDVIEEEIRPFALHGSRNIALQGNEVQLLPSAALALGMAVHELATNAVKYGALSDPAGVVKISWSVSDRGAWSVSDRGSSSLSDRGTAGVSERAASGVGGDSRAFLELEWVERGGPVVSPPDNTGFGMLLIQRGLSHELGGGAHLEFEAEGLRVRLRALADRALHRETEGTARG